MVFSLALDPKQVENHPIQQVKAVNSVPLQLPEGGSKSPRGFFWNPKVKGYTS